jgi:hypothetical protein
VQPKVQLNQAHGLKSAITFSVLTIPCFAHLDRCRLHRLQSAKATFQEQPAVKIEMHDDDLGFIFFAHHLELCGLRRLHIKVC